MNRILGPIAEAQAYTLAAMEEASKTGQRLVGVDHLFLALTLNEGVAGQVLRGAGATLERSRAAIRDMRAEQLAGLGITAPDPEGDIDFHSTGGYDLGEPVNEVLKRATARKQKGDTPAVLRALIAEPSGVVDEILERLGIAPGEVLSLLDDAEGLSHSAAGASRERDLVAGRYRAFIPAAVPEVWALLADPERLPEWDNLVARAEGPAGAEPGSGPAVGDVSYAWMSTHSADGKQLKSRPEYRNMRSEVIACDPEREIAWRLDYPDAPKANARRLEITLEHAAGGTQLAFLLAWERNPGRRRTPLNLLARPLYRFFVWMQLTQLSAGISRAFR
ncbi:Clp protease N-terminal domain-containing protein [Leucobacter luti]|uniref:SRPBCC family protein n=1 Tax=Leucobacter luti TaxID=340320 RepID=UPI003D015DE1